MTNTTLKDSIRIERLIGHKIKASIGPVQGCAKSEREARAICETAIIDVLQNAQTPRMEVRQGYLIISQIESSESAWYTIKRLSTLTEGHFYPLCMLHPDRLKAAINSHLAQYITDDVKVEGGQ